MEIKSNEIYSFKKSGNQVRAITPAAPYCGKPCWTVERVAGASAGKQMIVTADGLVGSLE